jgi:glycolate oxidase FAD binding subunit
VLVGIPAAVPAAAVAGLVQALRSRCGAWGGDVVVLDAPGAVREAVECWGPVRGLELMRRVKQRFDPGYLMAPGRFVGGI